MADIVDLPQRGNYTDTPSQLVSEILGMVQRGEVEGVSVVVVHTDGDVGVYATGTKSKYKMVGALEQLKHDILTAG